MEKRGRLIVSKISPRGKRKDIIEITGTATSYDDIELTIFENDKEFCFHIKSNRRYDRKPISRSFRVDVKCILNYIVYAL